MRKVHKKVVLSDMYRKDAVKVVLREGRDIVCSDGMRLEKQLRHHGKVTVFEHSLSVAVLCVLLAEFFRVSVDNKTLVRGALLHDYYLYDWHVPEKWHRLHGFTHAKRALQNADRDFTLNDVERNMIETHMFPMNLKLPAHPESVILCIADKLCAWRETAREWFKTLRRQ